MNSRNKKLRELNPSMLIHEISKLFQDRMSKSSETLGFKNGYRQILRLLAREDGVTQIDLVRATHLKAPTISVTLKKMEDEGLVFRKTDDIDQRQTHVYLTEKGRQTERVFFGNILETENIMFEGLTPEEMESLRELLQKVRNNLLNDMGLPNDWRSRS